MIKKDFEIIILVNCLNDIQFDDCVALKNVIAEEPDFEIFDKIQDPTRDQTRDPRPDKDWCMVKSVVFPDSR